MSKKTLTLLQLPQSPAEWETAIAQDFHTKWNFPNCLGAVDNTHIAIQKPAGSGSLYYNYKKFFSVVLTVVVDANCEFLVADIGNNGTTSDEQAFGLSPFAKALKHKDLNIPEPPDTGKSTNNSVGMLPFVQFPMPKNESKICEETLGLSGPWRDVTELTPIEIKAMPRCSGDIEDVRANFMRYFNNEGQVAWQEQEIDLI